MTDTDWTRHLPTEDRTEMATELAGLDGEQRDIAVAAWRSTAEVYGDPELLAALSRDGADAPNPIELDVTPQQRAAYQAAADASGQTLEAFLTAAVDAAAKAPISSVRVHDAGAAGLWAESPDRPGVFACGDTTAELAESLREAIAMTDDGQRQ